MKHLARALRKNMTDAERRLWSHLRDRQLGGYKFRRQKPIGPFIADFVCAKQKLIIEVDGGQHAVNTEADNRRTDYLKHNGWKILRFWNHEVLKEREAVLIRILDALEPPHPRPSPQRGEGETGAETFSEKGSRAQTSPGSKGERPPFSGKRTVYHSIPPPEKRAGTSQHPLSPQGRGLGVKRPT